MAGGQNTGTPGSIYRNVIAWNPSVSGATASAFGGTTELDVLSGIYTFADMLVNEVENAEGKSHTELQEIAEQWGAPWYNKPSAGNGYPILQWQYDRGDYRSICGFEESTGIELPEVPFTAGSGVYNLAGQRVGNPTRPGLYIIGGRKVLK